MGYNVSFLYPRAGGIETLTRALVARIEGGQVHTRAAPDAIDRDVKAGLIAAGALATPEDLLFAELKTIRWAYVVFDHDYYEATRTCFAYLEKKGIFSRGRYGAWTYNAMEDCILAGRAVAAELSA